MKKHKIYLFMNYLLQDETCSLLLSLSLTEAIGKKEKKSKRKKVN